MEHCTFCEIVAGKQAAHKVYEDDDVLAFLGKIARNHFTELDILPLRPGHLLVVPKQHYERLNHMPDALSAALGAALPRLARALYAAVSQPDYTLLSNQGYRQVVPHVHYHLIPAPRLDGPPPSGPAGLFLPREELDDDEGERVAELIRVELERERRAKL